jgi:hypothetical protein
MDIEKLEQARQILSIELRQNIKRQGTSEFNLLANSLGNLKVLLKRIEKKVKNDRGKK